MSINNFYPWFKLDSLNGFVCLAIGWFFILTLLYSLKFIKRTQAFQYYTYIVLTAIASLAAVLSNNLILLLVFWGFLGFTLYILINLGGKGADAVAKKTFIIVGGSDAVMLLGIGVIFYLTGKLQMDEIKLGFDNGLAILAYLCIAIASFAKAGAMPFHSWIPDCAEKAPVPVVAFLPASLDKLLGIYLLARISLNLFVMNEAMNILLMLVGAFTIIAAVMMALVQSEMRRLLSYLMIASTGYMLLGLGTANSVGIAGGLFYMLNSAIGNCCLFLCCGNVILKTNTSELDKLGGLIKFMPLTFISCFIVSLAISGIPPFNGFFSKWMIYQGLISQFQAQSYWMRFTSVLCLVTAMFGSGLTLASFMKLLHATFLGQASTRETVKNAKEVSWTMWLPGAILAAICVVFGVFANQLPLKYFILPAVKGVTFIGTWYAGLTTWLIITGLITGMLIFNLRPLKSLIRRDSAYVGSEGESLQETRVTGTDFYNTVRDFGVLKVIYKKAAAGFFDIYEQGKNLVFGIGSFFRYLHNGVLPTYLVWTLLGMIGLFLVLMR